MLEQWCCVMVAALAVGCAPMVSAFEDSPSPRSSKQTRDKIADSGIRDSAMRREAGQAAEQVSEPARSEINVGDAGLAYPADGPQREPPSPACAEAAKGACERLVVCSSTGLKALYGDVQACVQSLSNVCTVNLTLPDAGPATECVQSLAEAACAPDHAVNVAICEASSQPVATPCDERRSKTQIAPEAGNELRRFARLVVATSVQSSNDNKSDDVLETFQILLKTSDVGGSSLHTGGWTRVGDFADTGFRAELRDPHVASRNQVGHFLTAIHHAMTGVPGFVRMLIDGVLSDSARTFAMKVDIGHELAEDPELPCVNAQESLQAIDGWRKQYSLCRLGHIFAFESALKNMNDTADGVVDLEKLERDLEPLLGEIVETRLGNSRADMLLTLLGWKFGEMLMEGKLKTRKATAQWIERNLGDGVP